ncbi:Kinase, NEK [Spironucleus salmonicida]|uniref:Kinase, NEK n=1 Tax=Spironucleus salmonicida TaxID=348837 RepID=V6LE50_9EUKA|nr:Kinase, NEK [Spironucleus salmonicida]|eukprot:EST41971.1 Kinase, NEK [Spironucleus salmonicida]
MRLLPHTSNAFLYAENGVFYVEKRVPISAMSTQELLILSQIQHPLIVPLVSFSSDESQFKIKFPFYRKSDLNQQIKRRVQPLHAQTISKIAFQVLQALNYLHDRKIAHRDVKPANILISDSTDFHLTDFGISNQEALMKTCVGTPCFIAPEVLNQNSYSTSSDIWSLGVSLITLMQLENPFISSSMMQSFKFITEKTPKLNNFFRQFPQNLQIFVLGMLTDVERRPIASGLLQNLIFRGMKISQITFKNDQFEQTCVVDLGSKTNRTRTKSQEELIQELKLSEQYLLKRYQKLCAGVDQKISECWQSTECQAFMKFRLIQ